MRGLVALVGLCAGIVTGFLLVLSDPIGLLNPPPERKTSSLTQLVVVDSSGLGSSRQPRFAFGDEADPALPATTLKNARVDLALLKPDEPGASAMAVKLSAVSPTNDLLRARLSADVTWNIVWPNHGSIFLAGADNHWPQLKAASLSALTGGGFSLGEERFELTDLSPGTRFQGVVGGSGALTEVGGRYAEATGPGGEFVGSRLRLQARTN